MRVKETQPPASEGPASRAVALDKPLFQTHPLCTPVPPRRKMSIISTSFLKRPERIQRI